MAKAKQPLVVGRWSDDGDTFKALPEQPDAEITDMGSMILWVKANFKDTPGTYEFIRKVPGAFIATEQIEFAFKE